MKQVGIIGGAGYTAGELIRILLNHKEVAAEEVKGFIKIYSNQSIIFQNTHI